MQLLNQEFSALIFSFYFKWKKFKPYKMVSTELEQNPWYWNEALCKHFEQKLLFTPEYLLPELLFNSQLCDLPRPTFKAQGIYKK